MRTLISALNIFTTTKANCTTVTVKRTRSRWLQQQQQPEQQFEQEQEQQPEQQFEQEQEQQPEQQEPEQQLRVRARVCITTDASNIDIVAYEDLVLDIGGSRMKLSFN